MLSESSTVIGIALVEVTKHLFADIFSNFLHWSSKITAEGFLFFFRENSIKISSLLINCILMCVSESSSGTGHSLLMLSILTVVIWSSVHVWLVVDGTSTVSINSEETVSLSVINFSSIRAIDWNLSVVTT